MADGSQQVEGMQAMADMAQTMQAPPMPTGVSSIPFLRDEMIPRMEKQLTFAAKFKGIFGSESTYTILITAIKDYVKAKDDKAKAEPKKRILQTSNDWIKKHGESKDPNDVQKKQCIDRVKQALEPPAQAPQKKPEPKPAPPAPPPAPVPGVPAPVIPKIEDPTPVVEPVVEAGPSSQEPFERIKNDFEAYQEMASGTLEGAGTLFAACQKLYQVRTGITSWMKEFGKRTEEEDVERRGKLMLIEISMGALEADVNVTENLQMHVTGLDVNQLAKGKFFVRTMKVAMQMPSGAAIGELSNVEILAGAFHFSDLKLSYGGSMEVMTGFTISAPSLELSHEGAGYRVMAGGDLSLEAPGGAGVSNFTAKGRVQAGYDFVNKKLLSPTVERGELTATLFDALDICVDALDYAEGRLTASTGSLTIRALEKSVTTTVTDIAYSARDGITFQDVEVASSDTYEPVPGFTVNNPSVKYEKGKSIEINGGINLEIPELMSVSGDAMVRLDAQMNIQEIIVTGGACGFKKDGVTFDVKGITYDHSKKALAAEEATGSFPLFGIQANLKATGVSMSKGVTDFECLEGTIGGMVDTGFGLKVNNPSVKYEKGKSIVLSGGLNLQIPNLADATGHATVLFDSQFNILDISVENCNANASYAGLALNLEGIGFNYAEQKFSVTTAKGQLSIFDQQVVLTGTGISMDKASFDFERIEGEPPDANVGFFSLKGTRVAYSKITNAFEAKTSYSFNVSEAPAGFEHFSTSGVVDIFWSPSGEKYYSINDGKLVFTLLGQSAEATKFDYNSENEFIKVNEFKLDVDLLSIQQTFSGTDLSISESGLKFEKLTTDASGEPFDVKIFTITPNEYSIVKEDDGSLGVKAHGSVALSLPENLGIKVAGAIKGNVGVNFKNQTPTYEIEEGSASASMPNPLNKISKILGDNWSSSRFEMSAGIPVFPGISAIFGIYMQFGASFANELVATVKFDPKKKSVLLESSTRFDANVEGGVFGGVQGGSQLLIALALLLRAAGKFDLTTELGYSREFPMEKVPAQQPIKNDPAFTYNIKGEVKAIAYLDIVATALYFFQKRVSLKLGEKSLGEFEYSNAKKMDPDMKGKALATKKHLEDEIPEEKMEEARGLSLEQLLDFDSSHRFEKAEKKEVLDAIKNAEKARAQVQREEKQDPGESAKFNNVALANLQFYHEFVDKRCNWENIYLVLEGMGEKLQSKEELESLKEDKKNEYLTNTVLKNLKVLGESTNIAKVFVDHYKLKVDEFADAYPGATIAEYHALLLKKEELLRAVEKMKKDYLHSSFWGDEEKQKELIQTSSWFGKSKYEEFSIEYATFRQTMMANKDLLVAVRKEGEKTAFNLVQDHQRKTEERGRDSAQNGMS